MPKFKFFKDENSIQKSEDRICHGILNTSRKCILHSLDFFLSLRFLREKKKKKKSLGALDYEEKQSVLGEERIVTVK